MYRNTKEYRQTFWFFVNSLKCEGKRNFSIDDLPIWDEPLFAFDDNDNPMNDTPVRNEYGHSVSCQCIDCVVKPYEDMFVNLESKFWFKYVLGVNHFYGSGINFQNGLNSAQLAKYIFDKYVRDINFAGWELN